MSHSLNEIEALSKRASRGAGLSWGMSEEAGRAVRWLASHDLAGVDLLADVLTRNDQVPPDQTAPESLDGVWHAASGTLCPLSSGAALNDCADRLAIGQSITMANMSHPLLVVPFAAWAAIHIGAAVKVSWADTDITTDGFRVWVEGPNGAVHQTQAVSVICAQADPLDDRAAMPALRGTVTPSGWARLGVFAHRTYAPATEQSRVLGAGAGESDND